MESDRARPRASPESVIQLLLLLFVRFVVPDTVRVRGARRSESPLRGDTRQKELL